MIAEVFLGDQTKVAEIMTQEITFKYFLTDDKGNICTSFNHGDNFNFNFLIKNSSSDTLCIINDFLSNKSFCGVQNAQLANLQPFEYIGRDKVGSAAHQLPPEKEFFFTVPWIEVRDTTWRSLHCYFDNAHRDILPIGKYYTTFIQSFCFDRLGSLNSTFCTIELIFKINFEIV
jgi:hypothetical protein